MNEERKTIYLCLAHMSEEGWEQKYVKEAFDTNWIVPLGPNVNAFEASLAEFVNGVSEGSFSRKLGESEQSSSVKVSEVSGGKLDRKVVALSAGTAAVHLALKACGVGPGDEVCVQSFTFCASSHPITYLGAKPVFIDSEKETWNMDPELLERAILDRKAKTGKYPKAIVPVALYGMPYQIDKIMAIADKYGIPVIEDAAEGFGSRFNGQVLGTFGRFGVLSFNGNKMITTSGGGALICNSSKKFFESQALSKRAELERQEVSEVSEGGLETLKQIETIETAAEAANQVMWYATQARDAYPYYQHTAIGYNYRMSNVCAGIGRGQMTVANDHIKHHQHVQELYRELLKGIDGVHLHEQPVKKGSNGENIYDANFWLCTITLDENVRIQGQENAYKEVIKTAVGGAAGVIHQVDSPTTDCQPNDNVEALRVFMLSKKIEARPVWKPMHKQPVYCEGAEVSEISEGLRVSEGPHMVAYVNGVSEAVFKVGVCLPAGPYVTDEDVKYIVDSIKEAIVG